MLYHTKVGARKQCDKRKWCRDEPPECIWLRPSRYRELNKIINKWYRVETNALTQKKTRRAHEANMQNEIMAAGFEPAQANPIDFKPVSLLFINLGMLILVLFYFS